MYCPSCGAENVEGAKFCKQCGGQIDDAEASAPASAEVAASADSDAPPPPPPPPAAWGGQPAPQAGPQVSFDPRNLLFMKKVIESASRGVVFKRLVAITLYVLAGIIGLVVLFTGGQYVVNAFDVGDAGGIISGLLLIPLTLLALYMVVHTILIRAKDVRDLPESRYAVMPALSVLFKMFGELTAIQWIYAGVQAAITFWILPLGTRYYSRTLPAIDLGLVGFLGGFLTLLVCLAIAFVGFAYFYLLSELIVVFADMATDVKSMADAHAPAQT